MKKGFRLPLFVSRDLEDSHVEDEEAPIPIISPLETAAAPLEKLIDDGRTKVDQVEYLNRCETPVFSKLDEFTNDYVWRLSC